MNILKAINLLPTEGKFYHMLEALVAKAHHSSELLKILVEDDDPTVLEETRQAVSQTKTEAKKQFESITAEVCRTFITPFDREDIQAFAVDLYKITKMTEKIMDRIIVHHLRPANEDFNRQVALILEEADVLVDIIHELSNGRNSRIIQEKASRLHDLEDQGDVLLGQLIADLFKRSVEPHELILRKDVYDMLEHVIDYYRDAANVALQIILKHS